ncbi:TRAP transporter permease [Falsiroseomonas oryzae]|uniref:TRAP transporter permease n=1 Tax=Falsiroseomonas oryzae TaxID=2766473 RepID=UPI0022EB1845|nr:TRAP transporter fused permease subunit [Roseomonas sp. MO-31]
MTNRRALAGIDLAAWLTIGVVGLLVQLWLLYLNPISPLLHAMGFLSIVMVLAFLRYAPRSLPPGASQRVPWYDWLLAAASLVLLVHANLDYAQYVRRAAIPRPPDVWIGLVFVVLLLEAGRRAMGWILPLIGIAAMAYALSGFILPESWDFGPTLSLRRVVGTLTMTELGLFSEPTQVALRWIFLFVAFGQALALIGGDVFFERISIRVAGHLRGGPAYISVISSALFGTVSGSNVANVMMGGQVTIPLMARVGYGRTRAAAIEAVASTGGALTPPVMGAGALIMAELANVPYAGIVASAVLPAILFYIAVTAYVYGATVRLGIGAGEMTEATPAWRITLAYWPVLAGVVWLIWQIVDAYPLEHAALQATAIILVGGLLTSRASYTWPRTKEAMAGLIDGTLEIGLACAISGILVGVILVTGLGIELSSFVIGLGRTSLLLALIATMLVVILLGMAVPGIAAYIIAASVAAAPLAELGVPLLAAHMFIFYFSLFAGLTPPVALTAFAAAGIAGSDPFRTGFLATAIAAPAYLLAYFMVLQPQLLLLDGTASEIALGFVTAGIGVTAFGLGVAGAIFRPLGPWARAAMILAGVALVDAGLLTDLVGLATIAGVVALNRRGSRSQPA